MKQSPIAQYADNTWMEPEEYCYPNGGFKRRARVRFNGKFYIAKVSIPDTYFSVPAKIRIKGKTIKGYVFNNQGLHFSPDAPWEY